MASNTELKKEKSEFDSLSIPEKILTLYSFGADDWEVCAGLQITKADFINKYENDSVFKKCVDYGRTVERAWWTKQGRLNLNDKTFNSSVYSLHMKNRFAWAEKAETTTKDVDNIANMTPEEIRQKIEQMQPQVTAILKAAAGKGTKIN